MMPARYFDPSSDRTSRRAIRSTRIILVEGPDDLWFFDALLTSLGADPAQVQVMDYGGFPELEVTLDLLLADDHVLDGDVIGILVTTDCDKSPTKRTYDLRRLCKKLQLGELTVGTFTECPGVAIRKAGIYLLPSFENPGNLETLLLSTISDSTAAIDARAFVEAHHAAKAPENDKRVTQAYLATRPNLSRGAGMGAHEGYFLLNHEALGALSACVRELLDQ